MNFLTSYYHDSGTGPGASFVETGDLTVLNPLNPSIDVSNWNFVHERSYHITLTVNVATIQAILRQFKRICLRFLTNSEVRYVFFVSPYSGAHL